MKKTSDKKMFKASEPRYYLLLCRLMGRNQKKTVSNDSFVKPLK